MDSQDSSTDWRASRGVGAGKRVRVYVGESDQTHGRPLYMALLELLRAEGCAGATVIRGIAGFGASSRIHTAAVLRLSEDLPVVIEWIDTAGRVERLLPRVVAEIRGGLVTVEDVQVAHYSHRQVGDVPRRVTVGEVMTRDVATVSPADSLTSAVDLLLNRRFRALPVVDPSGAVAGIVTSGDLVERGGLGMRIEMLRQLPADAVARELRAAQASAVVSDVMTRDPVTVSADLPIVDAAHLMVGRRLKRLPVIESSGKLMGMVSRVDLLRTASESFAEAAMEPPQHWGRSIGEVIRKDVPLLSRGSSLTEVLEAIVSTRLNQALVLDDAGRVVGIVSDAELVQRLSPRDHPSVARALMSRTPFSRLTEEERRGIERATGLTAEALMDSRVTTVRSDVSIAEATSAMVRARRKILPVVDEEDRLLGAVDRADLLRVLLVEGEGKRS